MTNYGHTRRASLKGKLKLSVRRKVSAGYENNGFISKYKIAHHPSWS
jgi:hypothetical protein